MWHPPPAPTPYRQPILWMRRGFIVLLAGILLGYWNVQIRHHTRYLRRAELNQRQSVRLYPPRGIIFDRHAHVLADTRMRSVLVWHPQNRSVRPLTVVDRFLQHMDWEPAVKARRRRIADRLSVYYPMQLNWVLDLDDIARFEFFQEEFPNLFVELRPMRDYPHGPVFAHVIGYTGWVTEEERTRWNWTDLPMDAMVGKTGIERYYEPVLHGTYGRTVYLVDRFGLRLHEIRDQRRPPQTGHNIMTTLDLRLQQIAYSVLQGRQGAFVAVDPRDGAVRAMVSVPAFDPNAFIPAISVRTWRALVQNPAHPLQNRAIQGLYAPGSTFKVVMAVAALREGWVRPDDRVYCPGYARFFQHTFRCWRPGGHGRVDLHRAIVESCDVYFYHIGARVSIDRIAEYASHFGYGVPTGIDLPGERGGLVPTSYWKQKHRGEPWYAGETVSVAIGQGPLLVTPLQQAMMMAMVWNRGVQYRPYIVAEIRSGRGRVLVHREPRVINRLQADAWIWDFMHRSLCDVVTSGTGRRARNDVVRICGKTGTVELLTHEERVPVEVRERLKYHAWFIGWVDDPEDPMAFALIVEHSGHGGEIAAPLVRKIFVQYFRNRRSMPDRLRGRAGTVHVNGASNHADP